jgi:hypothetical protein
MLQQANVRSSWWARPVASRRTRTWPSCGSTFGTDGKLTIDFIGGIDSAEAIIEQPDRKLVVGGFARERRRQRVRGRPARRVAGPPGLEGVWHLQ